MILPAPRKQGLEHFETFFNPNAPLKKLITFKWGKNIHVLGCKRRSVLLTVFWPAEKALMVTGTGTLPIKLNLSTPPTTSQHPLPIQVDKSLIKRCL